jgi:hypothetical protein
MRKAVDADVQLAVKILSIVLFKKNGNIQVPMQSNIREVG